MSLSLNILAITGSGMFAGALLSISLILGGIWKNTVPTEFASTFKQHMKLITILIPVLLIPTIVGNAGSFWLSETKEARTLWLLACGCVVIFLIFTATWFGPTNAQFASGSIPVDQLPKKIKTWLFLHYFRIVLILAASVLGSIALTR